MIEYCFLPEIPIGPKLQLLISEDLLLFSAFSSQIGATISKLDYFWLMSISVLVQEHKCSYSCRIEWERIYLIVPWGKSSWLSCISKSSKRGMRFTDIKHPIRQSKKYEKWLHKHTPPYEMCFMGFQRLPSDMHWIISACVLWTKHICMSVCSLMVFRQRLLKKEHCLAAVVSAFVLIFLSPPLTLLSLLCLLTSVTMTIHGLSCNM